MSPRLVVRNGLSQRLLLPGLGAFFVLLGYFVALKSPSGTYLMLGGGVGILLGLYAGWAHRLELDAQGIWFVPLAGPRRHVRFDALRGVRFERGRTFNDITPVKMVVRAEGAPAPVVFEVGSMPRAALHDFMRAVVQAAASVELDQHGHDLWQRP